MAERLRDQASTINAPSHSFAEWTPESRRARTTDPDLARLGSHIPEPSSTLQTLHFESLWLVTFFLKTLPLTTRSLLKAHKDECASVARPLRSLKG